MFKHEEQQRISPGHLPGIEELQTFASRHPAISNAMLMYGEGLIDYEEMLLLCVNIMIQEYEMMRKSVKLPDGGEVPPLVRFEMLG